jgi:hypothetical protein
MLQDQPAQSPFSGYIDAGKKAGYYRLVQACKPLYVFNKMTYVDPKTEGRETQKEFYSHLAAELIDNT